MSSSNCCFLTGIQVSQEAGQVVWYPHLFQNFPQFIVIHKFKGCGVVNKAEVDVFLELSCYFDDPTDVGNLIMHLEPDILGCKVRWALGSITMNKANGGDGIPVELFQILKDDTMKVLLSICQQIWKTQQCTGLGKVSFHSNPKERQCQRMLKLQHNCTHLPCQQSNAHHSP